MRKPSYLWWSYIKDIIQKFPERRDLDTDCVARREWLAVKDAVEDTKSRGNGENRLDVIRLVLWDRTHTVEGAALTVPCSRRTAMRWQREFFEEVARNRDLLD